MATFNDFDLEIQNESDSQPEHFNGSITTAGSPSTITPATSRDIGLAFVKNPNRGPNQNNFSDVLLVSLDGGSTYTSLSRGESVYLPGMFTSLLIDSNNNNVNYEIIVWS